MTTTASIVYRRPLILPVVIFSVCILIRFLPVFQSHAGALSTAITLDLALTAPLLYFIARGRTTVSGGRAVLRVFIAGVFIAGLLLTTSNPLLAFIKKWISPVAELTVLLYVARQFYTGVRKARATDKELDFVMHCRMILEPVFGSARAATIIASEVAVFYYLFAPKQKANGITQFSTYKESGSLMILYTFLCLFGIETVGMHFVFSLWDPTAAWIFTGLSTYTCLQLLAHIRAVKARPAVLSGTAVLLRNGLLGGEVTLPYHTIDSIELTRKTLAGEGVLKLALIKGLENHNVAIYLKQPVVVTKAFGITRKATVLLLSADDAPAFAEAVQRAMEASRDTLSIKQNGSTTAPLQILQ